jgi:hypothetical protein
MLGIDRVNVQFAETGGEIPMLNRRQRLIAKKQHMMFRQCRDDRLAREFIERIGQPNSLGHGADAGSQARK